MYTINRDGKDIILTDEEVRDILRREHEEDIRYEYENAVQFAEEEKQISFDSWQECDFAGYESEADARADFIEKLTEDYLEQEELYERDPNGFRAHDFNDDVLELAEDLGYRKEEG